MIHANCVRLFSPQLRASTTLTLKSDIPSTRYEMNGSDITTFAGTVLTPALSYDPPSSAVDDESWRHIATTLCHLRSDAARLESSMDFKSPPAAAGEDYDRSGDLLYKSGWLANGTPVYAVPNTGPHALTIEQRNFDFIRVESTLFLTCEVITEMLDGSPNTEVPTNVYNNIVTTATLLEEAKSHAWHIEKVAARLKASVSEDGTTVVSNRPVGRRLGVLKADGRIMFFIVLILTLYLVCGLSEDSMSVTIWGIQHLIAAVGPDSVVALAISALPKTVTQYLDYLSLRPVETVAYACSKCHQLYFDRPVPGARCSARYQCSPCGQPLSSASKVHIQSLFAWIGSRLQRPGWEERIIQYRAEVRRRRAGLADTSRMRDIWDGSGLYEIPRSGQSEAGFFSKFTPNDGDSPDDIHLAFALGVDGFNPYTMKIAGVKASAHAVVLICLSLPPEMRYEPDNIFIYNVFPGNPNTEQSNNILRPLVESLRELWNGVHYDWTYTLPSGRTVRAVIGPLLCDLLAARTIVGHASHSSKSSACTRCNASTTSWESSSFTPREADHQRRAAEDWNDAPTLQQRKDIFAAFGTRYSILYELPYFNAVTMAAPDSLHQILLGMIQTFCRDTWGMDSNAKDTEAIEPEPAIEVPRAILAEASACLLRREWEDLETYPRSILYRLCWEHKLRRGSKVKAYLLGSLKQWVSQFTASSNSDPSTAVTLGLQPAPSCSAAVI